MIAVVGFMGAGKTTVGALLAARLGLPFADSDQVIEQRLGRSVREIFAADGEAAFRAAEHEALAGLLRGPAAVLAAGGGAVEHPATRQLLGAVMVVYLRVSYAEAVRRVGRDPGRPLLARPGLRELYARRLGLYEAVATLTVGAEGRPAKAVCQEVVSRLAVAPGLPQAPPGRLPSRGSRPGSGPKGGVMRIGMALNYAGGFAETVDELADYERAGLDIVFVPEAYSFDAVSQLGYIAAKTTRLQIASGILQLYSRTPALTAMTAAGLDYVSGGRFTLGIGASGPQVIEGWHGVPYDAPLGRARELIEICRMVWRRERLEYQGRHYQVPLPAGQGTGLGKPLKLINHPVRDAIPIVLAAIGPRNVALAAELAEGWEPIFYLPEKAAQVWGEALAAGRARRDPALGPLDVVAQAALAIGEDVSGYLDLLRPMVALYVGGMGAPRDKGPNFYFNLATRYGYGSEAEKIQDAYLSGRKDEAAAHVPRELIQRISLIGSAGFVADRLAALRETGVTTLNVTPLASSHAERVALIEKIRVLAG